MAARESDIAFSFKVERWRCGGGGWITEGQLYFLVRKPEAFPGPSLPHCKELKVASGWQQWGTEAVWSIAQKVLNLASNHMSLEADPSTVKTSDRTPALADTLIVVSWETLKWKTQLGCVQISDPPKPWDNECVVFWIAKFVVICLAIVGNKSKAFSYLVLESTFLPWGWVGWSLILCPPSRVPQWNLQ